MPVYLAVYASSRRFLSTRFFFFQAEDGIRDLVRSRGLGDVYKRQAMASVDLQYRVMQAVGRGGVPVPPLLGYEESTEPVSYTHLTLPTSDLV